jgi:hypothetical protein
LLSLKKLNFFIDRLFTSDLFLNCKYSDTTILKDKEVK